MLHFDHTHYVPILRWKQAERGALEHLQPTDAARLTPLIEPVLSRRPTANSMTAADVLSRIPRDIANSWGLKPVFVDPWLLPDSLRTSEGHHPLTALARHAADRHLSIIPVTGIDREPHYQAAVLSMLARDTSEVCIRLFYSDFARHDLPARLCGLLSYLHTSPEDAHLLVDCQFVQSGTPSLADLCRQIPLLNRWRTFTVAAGAFPVDLAGFEKNRQHTLRRLDWLTWRDAVVASPPLPRLPSYSDYTIQHPIYNELEGFRNFSGSIRYTHNDYWVIMRGEGVFNPGGPGFAQFPANAQLLCERSEFCGPHFSQGDRYIYEMGLQLTRTGNAATWLQAGINHHLTFVVRQIASLFAPEAAAES